MLICDLKHRQIKFRPWKVRDKFNIKTAKTLYEKRKALVYNCLENPDTPLDSIEFQYVLFCIRNASLNYTTDYEVQCKECEKDFQVNVDFKQALVPHFADYTPISTAKHVFEIGDVANQEFYETSMFNEKDPDRRFLLDFILHVKSVDEDITFNSTRLLDFLEEMDISEYEELMTKWNSQKFSYALLGHCKCPHCSAENSYSFSVVPNFFPETWGEVN